MDTINTPMSAQIDTHFVRVEKALETLIKSLSTYNPSPALANELEAADAELNSGLEECLFRLSFPFLKNKQM